MRLYFPYLPQCHVYHMIAMHMCALVSWTILCSMVSFCICTTLCIALVKGSLSREAGMPSFFFHTCTYEFLWFFFPSHFFEGSNLDFFITVKNFHLYCSNSVKMFKFSCFFTEFDIMSPGYFCVFFLSLVFSLLCLGPLSIPLSLTHPVCLSLPLLFSPCSYLPSINLYINLYTS